MSIERIAVSKSEPAWRKQAAESLGIECVKLDNDSDDIGLVEAAKEVGALWGTARSFESARRLRKAADEAGVTYVGPTFSDTAPTDIAAQRQLAESLGIKSTREELVEPRTLAFPVTRVGDDLRAVHEWELSCFFDGAPLLAEAPSPFVVGLPDGQALRGALLENVRQYAKAIDLQGVGCAYFSIDGMGSASFEAFLLSVRVGGRGTQLLDHVNLFVTELLLGTGQPISDETISTDFGHVIEAAVPGKATAEFKLPPGKPGKLHFLRAPAPGRLAQITALARIRHRAILQLDRAIALVLWPEECKEHIKNLRRVLNHEAFRAGQYNRDLQ